MGSVPVPVRFRFNEIPTDSLERFGKTLSSILKRSLESADYPYADGEDCSFNFSNAIE